MIPGGQPRLEFARRINGRIDLAPQPFLGDMQPHCSGVLLWQNGSFEKLHVFRHHLWYKNVQKGGLMQYQCKVYFGLIEAPSRLAELGLREELLIEGVKRGQAGRASCTRNHPAIYHGFRAWAETVCGVRDLLRPLGWTRADSGNLPLTVDAGKKIYIAVSTGDEDTGRRGCSPCTRSKGPLTRSVVKENADQYRLFQEVGVRLRPDDLKEINDRMTWILLFHYDANANEVRCELSRPIRMNNDGEVDGWAERIILGSISPSGDRIKVPDNVPQTPDVTVDIKRKRA